MDDGKILSAKETKLLENLSKNPNLSQRELSKSTGISLGLINVILKRFIEMGYIQVSHLNKQKMDYLLTKEGLVATAKGTCRFANHTIRAYRTLHDNLFQLIENLYKSGHRYFSIHGEGEVRDLLLSIFQKFGTNSEVTLGAEHRSDPESVVLNISVEPLPDFEGKVIPVLERL